MDILKSPTPELVARANNIRKTLIGDKLELCSIVNAKSGLCAEDCKFCAQSARYSTGTPSYSLKDKEEIIDAAREAKSIGAEKFGIVTSGNRLNKKEIDNIASAVNTIKEDVGVSVCASLGGLDKHEFSVLKDAGLERYHHNIETSERFYSNVVSTHAFKDRIDTIRAAKGIGLRVCSGGIIGMGESWEDRLEMARMLKNLEVDSVPINFLVPIEGTPFASLDPISCDDAIKSVAIFRIILEDKVIKIAAGREAILKDSQSLGFLAGANGMLIGGYLTVKGRSIEDDQRLVREIKKLWSE